MADTYVGVSGVPRRLNECYVGVGGVPRAVTEIYVGVGGVPRLAWRSIPSSYAFLQLVTSSTSWTVPKTGWYKFYCVGRSGNGEKGNNGDWTNGIYATGGFGGMGGSSGGTSVSIMKLSAGTVVPMTVTATTTSVSNWLSATSGEDGNYKNTNQGTGNGYGGNISNAPGLKGGAGGKGQHKRRDSDGDYVTLESSTNGQGVGGNSGGVAATKPGFFDSNSGGGGGGSGNNLQGLDKYYSFINKYGGNGGLYQSQMATMGGGSPGLGSTVVLYGSGGGGGGRGVSIANNNDASGLGGVGTPGCIIIERGV